MHALKITIITILTIAITLYLVVCLLIYIFQEKLIFIPEKLPKDYQFNFDYPFEELNFKTEKNVEINAIYFKAKNPKGVVLYFHGNAGSLKHWGAVSEEFIDLGYDLLIHDFREYGKSTGNITQKALFHDGQFLYNYLKEKYPQEKIIIYGRSIGTGIATKIAADNNPGTLILMTPYLSISKLGKDLLPYLPVKLLVRFPLRNEYWIERVNCPILIFHGTADEVIPFSHSLQLKQIGQSKTNLVLIEQGSHNNLTTFPEYRDTLRQWMNDRMRE